MFTVTAASTISNDPSYMQGVQDGLNMQPVTVHGKTKLFFIDFIHEYDYTLN